MPNEDKEYSYKIDAALEKEIKKGIACRDCGERFETDEDSYEIYCPVCDDPTLSCHACGESGCNCNFD